MDRLEEKADAMLHSPLGCGFLLAAAASGLSPAEIAAPRNSLYLCACASVTIDVWQGEPYYSRIRDEIMRQGQQHRELALSVLEQPDAATWFGPLDTESQVWVSQHGQAPDPARFIAPASPLSNWERYAEKPQHGMFTSTLTSWTAAILVGIDQRVGDLTGLSSNHGDPYPLWFLKADQSARVFEVDGPQAWHDLCARYPAAGIRNQTTPDFSMDEGRIVPDWPAVAVDWDAVHLTFGGLLTAEQVRVESSSGWTYHWSWNVEQTLWLRWMFTHVERMPDHQPERSPPFSARAEFY